MRKFQLFFIVFLTLCFFSRASFSQAIEPTEEPGPSIAVPRTMGVPLATPTSLPSYPTVTETKKSCDQIGKDTVYPPNGECYPKVTEVETDIEKYPLTCVLPPEVTYKETIVGNSPPTSVDVIVTHDVSEAQLGGYGPSLSVLSASKNMDDIAKSYLFNGLYDKPFYSLKQTPREAYRTYWRYLSSYEQSNNKALFLNKAGKSIKNVYWKYIDSGGSVHETNARELLNELPRCLKSNPVCDTYYEAYLGLGINTRNKYDTFLPFDFDDQRGFLVLNGQITRENITYLNAIISASTGKTGLFNYYTPGAFIKAAETFSTTTNESSLNAKVLAKGTIVNCSLPAKTSVVSAPKTYPTPITLNQTVKVNLTAKLVNSFPGYCSGGLYCDSYYDSVSCFFAGCSWREEVNIFELNGKNKGKPMAVLNNPVVNAITHTVLGDTDKKLPSFFKMMLPNFAKVPDKVAINSSGVNTTTSTPNASVGGGSGIIRDDNLAQDSMHLLQNCWLVPGDLQKSSKCPKKAGPMCSDKPMENPNNCNLCSTFLDSKIPPALKKLLESAASKYNVPPSLILAQMFAEGGFEKRCAVGGYTDDDVLQCKISRCGSCNVYQGEDGGPFGWMSIYFDPVIKKVYSDFKLPDAKGDMCNMWDGAMTSAKALGQAADGGAFAAALASYEAAVGGKTSDDPLSCVGVPYNTGGKSGSSCSKDTWTKSDVISAIRYEQGFCGENINESDKGGLIYTQKQMLVHIYHFLAIYNCAQDLVDTTSATNEQMKAYIQAEISKMN